MGSGPSAPGAGASASESGFFVNLRGCRPIIGSVLFQVQVPVAQTPFAVGASRSAEPTKTKITARRVFIRAARRSKPEDAVWLNQRRTCSSSSSSPEPPTKSYVVWLIVDNLTFLLDDNVGTTKVKLFDPRQLRGSNNVQGEHVVNHNLSKSRGGPGNHLPPYIPQVVYKKIKAYTRFTHDLGQSPSLIKFNMDYYTTIVKIRNLCLTNICRRSRLSPGSPRSVSPIPFPPAVFFLYTPQGTSKKRYKI